MGDADNPVNLSDYKDITPPAPPVMQPLTEEIKAPELPSADRITIRREMTRERITIWLIVILAIEIGVGLMGQLVPWPNSVKETLSLVFTPTVALVGTVLGFYFGDKSEGG